MFGPVNVTRAVRPIMRTQRFSLADTISSTAGIVGQQFCTPGQAHAHRELSSTLAHDDA